MNSISKKLRNMQKVYNSNYNVKGISQCMHKTIITGCFTVKENKYDNERDNQNLISEKKQYKQSAIGKQN